jgi:hypothetical protein
MILVVYGNVIPKIDIIRFLIPFTVFSLAIFNVLSVNNRIGSNEKYVFLFPLFFGFFNGLGSSADIISQFERHESEFVSIIEVALGAGASVFVIILILLTLFTLLRKIPRFDKRVSILTFSIAVLVLSIPLMFGQVFG